MEQSILITGGLGYLGGRILEKLSQNNKCIFSSRVYTEVQTVLPNRNIICVEHQTLLNSETFPKNVETVIHLAAMNEVDCLTNESAAIEVNIIQTNKILENAIKNKVKNFIYFSTAHVYGAPLNGTISEVSPTQPIHPYAITHRAAEDFVIAAHIKGAINGIVLRLSNAFGPPLTLNVNRWMLLASDLCKQAVEKKSITLYSNGCQWRNFICISDVVNFMEYLISSISKFDLIIYNLGSRSSLRIIDMAQTIAEIFKKQTGEILPISFPPNTIPTNELGLNIITDRIQNTGFVFQNNIEAEIEALLIFCKKHFSSSTI